MFEEGPGLVQHDQGGTPVEPPGHLGEDVVQGQHLHVRARAHQRLGLEHGQRRLVPAPGKRRADIQPVMVEQACPWPFGPGPERLPQRLVLNVAGDGLQQDGFRAGPGHVLRRHAQFMGLFHADGPQFAAHQFGQPSQRPVRSQLGHMRQRGHAVRTPRAGFHEPSPERMAGMPDRSAPVEENHLGAGVAQPTGHKIAQQHRLARPGGSEDQRMAHLAMMQIEAEQLARARPGQRQRWCAGRQFRGGAGGGALPDAANRDHAGEGTGIHQHLAPVGLPMAGQGGEQGPERAFGFLAQREEQVFRRLLQQGLRRPRGVAGFALPAHDQQLRREEPVPLVAQAGPGNRFLHVLGHGLLEPAPAAPAFAHHIGHHVGRGLQPELAPPFEFLPRAARRQRVVAGHPGEGHLQILQHLQRRAGESAGPAREAQHRQRPVVDPQRLLSRRLDHVRTQQHIQSHRCPVFRDTHPPVLPEQGRQRAAERAVHGTAGMIPCGGRQFGPQPRGSEHGSDPALEPGTFAGKFRKAGGQVPLPGWRCPGQEDFQAVLPEGTRGGQLFERVLRQRIKGGIAGSGRGIIGHRLPGFAAEDRPDRVGIAETGQAKSEGVGLRIQRAALHAFGVETLHLPAREQAPVLAQDHAGGHQHAPVHPVDEPVPRRFAR